MVATTISTSICCLDRLDIYRREKPYEMRFIPPGNFPRKNLSISKHNDIAVKDVRGCESELSLRKNGFFIMSVPNNFDSKDFEDDDFVRQKYLPLVSEALKKHLGASRVQVHDYLVRKSEPSFPISTGKPYAFEQPATLLHVDSTPRGTYKIAEDLNPNEKELLNTRHQYVTIWKPLLGPVKRWPLMLCDNRSVEDQQDLEARDMVYYDKVVDTALAYYSDAYRFFYLRDQQPDEAWVMLQSDSANLVGVPHTAFENPLADNDSPQRESIEVRTLVYY